MEYLLRKTPKQNNNNLCKLFEYVYLKNQIDPLAIVHFNQYAGISESECWRNCISLEKCVAVIYLDGGCCYDPPVTCWLYTKDYVLNRDTANWKVYSKRPL